ncbi:hypothetical protein PAMH19_4388 [Pseudomonas aeruginosa]|nr:hypothetical protein PAMH19_4388 [Pseudomonas aeruginosa]
MGFELLAIRPRTDNRGEAPPARHAGGSAIEEE